MFGWKGRWEVPTVHFGAGLRAPDRERSAAPADAGLASVMGTECRVVIGEE